MKEKNNGFTLIELLAVIVILAIIALIATPIVLNLIEKARKGAAQDSAYGVRKSAQLYYQTSLIDSPSGLTENIVFNCNGISCTDGNNKLDIDGTIPKNGEIEIKPNGEIIYSDIIINGYSCKIENSGVIECTKAQEKETLINKTYTSGEAVTIGGYDWHVIGDDGNNVTLLMDYGQFSDFMIHCTNDPDVSTDCLVDSTGNYPLYSWDKSLIRSYLNETLYSELSNKINNMVPTEICADPSTVDGTTTYGGYLIDEIEKIDSANCATTVNDFVRLMSYSEYYNLSPMFSGTDPKYPNVIGISKLSSSSDYENWLSSNSIGLWSLMTSYSGNESSHAYRVHGVHPNNGINYNYSYVSRRVRPVITISK